MELYVFVSSIKKDISGVVVEACNGNTDGPPLVRFRITYNQALTCHVGKRYKLNIEEENNA